MGGLANLFISTKRLMLRAGYRMSSAEIGKKFSDLLQLDVRQDTWNNNCLGSEGATNCPGNEVIGPITYAPQYNITPLPGTDLKKVVINVEPQ